MSNPWFRLYSEFADDPKVQRMSEAMQRRLVMLFCLRCKNETFDETLQGFQWRLTPEDLAETKKLFLSNGFIDENWDLLNWNRRQFISDSSTERVRQYRERMKRRETLQDDDSPEDIERDETERNVTVTAPEQNRTDSDSDTDAEHTQKQTQSALLETPKMKVLSSQELLKKAQKPELPPDALGELAIRIALRHPRSRMKNANRSNLIDTEISSILFAMQDEAQERGCEMVEVGEFMLQALDAWDEIPQDRWQYVPAIPKFYKQGEWRTDPNKLPGIAQQEGRKHGNSNGKQRGTDGNEAVVLEALSAARHDGLGSGTTERENSDSLRDAAFVRGLREETGGEDGGVIPSGADGPDSAPTPPGVQSSYGRVQVLAKPSYPSRISWRPGAR